MIDPLHVDEAIDRFLAEDIGFVDLTSSLLIDAGRQGTFDLNAREEMVVSGVEIATRVFRRYVDDAVIDIRVKDAERVAKGTVLARVSGEARRILTAERLALNLIQHMSGIATQTAIYVDRIEGTKARLVDTRKTTPGLRMFEKYAVACGGGRNHRLGLDSGVMIKDNHIVVCGGLANAVARARATVPILTKIEVECDRLDQVEEALAAGADIIMLDNMTLDMLTQAVRMVDGRIPLEASGGVNLDTIRPIAETGVDFISVGRITQSSPAVDIGLDEATG